MRRRILPLAAALIFASLLTGWSAENIVKTAPEHTGQVVDWSSNHILYPQGTSLRALALSQRDPRAYWNYLRLTSPGAAPTGDMRTIVGPRPMPGKTLRRHTDWAVSLGLTGSAANMFPAKYSFDVNATPDCTNDFVVYTVNRAPSATQANIAAFNNLYSGSASTSCGTNTAASVTWAYRAGTTRIRTSPIISLDGTKVAFMDGANPPNFYVLTPTAGQGTVLAPVTPTAAQLVTLSLAAGTGDTDSSPFIDYFKDIAYVGTNNGRIYAITGVFKGTPALAATPFPLTAGATRLTAPVVDFNTGNLFVGSANGDLYGFNATSGAAITSSPSAIGSGRADGGIADSPVVDVVNGLIYVSTGDNAARTDAVVAQTSTSSFATVHTAPIGTTESAILHPGAFNAAYFSQSTNGIGTTNEWFFYACGVATGGTTNPVLYRVGFSAARVMNATANGTNVSLSANNGEVCSPITEFQNGVDRLFLGLLTTATVEFFDVSTTTTPTRGGTGGVMPVAEAGGTSGIIVDNVSAEAQASSIYFTTLATGTCSTSTIAPSPVGAKELTGTTVTITTTAAHGFGVGESVTIAGVGVGGYNGVRVVTSVPTSTTFQYTNPTSPLANSGGGTATSSGFCAVKLTQGGLQ